MTEINTQNFEHNALEADIQRLGKEISEKRNLPEYKDLPDKELVRKSLQPLVKNYPAQQAVSNQSVQQNQLATNDQEDFLPYYLENSSPEIKLKVEKMVDLAFHQGIDKAAKVAREEGDFFVDALHDVLTNKLYEELKSRKII